ncbi:MAG: hypothetical protein HY319_23245 [Armatimonadetes bacterium]|nr:hypothetical protein [Armatimonadota bacterium]
MAGKIEFRELLEALTRHRVRMVVIGGVAMVLHGSSHLTRDLDIAYGRNDENLKALVEALAPYSPRLRGAPEDLPFRWDARTLKAGLNFTLATSVGDVDVLGDAPGAPPFEEMLAHALDVDLGAMKVPIASLDDLIRMKRAAGRPKDRLHIMELEALKRLLAEG